MKYYLFLVLIAVSSAHVIRRRALQFLSVTQNIDQQIQTLQAVIPDFLSTVNSAAREEFLKLYSNNSSPRSQLETQLDSWAKTNNVQDKWTTFKNDMKSKKEEVMKNIKEIATKLPAIIDEISKLENNMTLTNTEVVNGSMNAFSPLKSNIENIKTIVSDFFSSRHIIPVVSTFVPQNGFNNGNNVMPGGNTGSFGGFGGNGNGNFETNQGGFNGGFGGNKLPNQGNSQGGNQQEISNNMGGFPGGFNNNNQNPNNFNNGGFPNNVNQNGFPNQNSMNNGFQGGFNNQGQSGNTGNQGTQGGFNGPPPFGNNGNQGGFTSTNGMNNGFQGGFNGQPPSSNNQGGFNTLIDNTSNQGGFNNNNQIPTNSNGNQGGFGGQMVTGFPAIQVPQASNELQQQLNNGNLQYADFPARQARHV